MTKLAWGTLLLVGCAPLLEKLHGGDDKPTAPTDGRGEIIDSLAIADGNLVFAFNSENVFGRFQNDQGVLFVLTGPDGTKAGYRTDSTTHSTIAWEDQWREGTYTLAFTWFGRELDHKQFEVKMIPSPKGRVAPYVVRSTDPPVVFSPGDQVVLQTAVLVDVTRPVTEARFVWTKGDKVLNASSDVLRIGGASLGGPLAEFKLVRGTVEHGIDYTGATLYLFEGDDTLVGAWSYAEPAPGQQHIILPAVTPDPKQRPLVRKLAAETTTSRDTALEITESIACAAAASAKVREAITDFEGFAFAEGDAIDRAATKAEEAQDTRLSREEREQARMDQRISHDSVPSLVESGKSKRAFVIAAARKYKKGCLVALGVPRLSTPKKF
jgi:hypothetical protein